mmetsp:Transcript_29860/g.96351  ORF Transcript_29860/g.96351 Transcript_29860/m.96351 type:complete len:351 (+) Transcript_29860:203-1255(+)
MRAFALDELDLAGRSLVLGMTIHDDVGDEADVEETGDASDDDDDVEHRGGILLLLLAVRRRRSGADLGLGDVGEEGAVEVAGDAEVRSGRGQFGLEVGGVELLDEPVGVSGRGFDGVGHENGGGLQEAPAAASGGLGEFHGDRARVGDTGGRGDGLSEHLSMLLGVRQRQAVDDEAALHRRRRGRGRGIVVELELVRGTIVVVVRRRRRAKEFRGQKGRRPEGPREVGIDGVEVPAVDVRGGRHGDVAGVGVVGAEVRLGVGVDEAVHFDEDVAGRNAGVGDDRRVGGVPHAVDVFEGEFGADLHVLVHHGGIHDRRDVGVEARRRAGFADVVRRVHLDGRVELRLVGDE